MAMVSIIDKKRRGGAHADAEIAWLVAAMMAGELPDYQLSAWLMAVCINGMTPDETVALTRAYVESGTRLCYDAVFGDAPALVVDKHSTGGVGDKVTLVLLPLLAAAGLKVAKLSGRGLGFTGGTIDKLESIPGFRVSLDNAAFTRQLKDIGIALSSQTADLAPADAKTYALRDVTATVESIPLIAASVVSKKIAAGAHVIVLDIKVGRGAFMKTMEDALALAELCQYVGRRLGRAIGTVISPMDEPLGYAVGNALEVAEAIETLKGRGPQDLTEATLALGARVLVEAGRYTATAPAEAYLRGLIENGAALACFRTWIHAQGGDAGIINDPSRLPQAQYQVPILAEQAGVITAIDPLAIAEAALAVGAGRKAKGDAIHHGTGVVLNGKAGTSVQPQDTVATLYCDKPCSPDIIKLISEAFTMKAIL